MSSNNLYHFHCHYWRLLTHAPLFAKILRIQNPICIHYNMPCPFSYDIKKHIEHFLDCTVNALSFSLLTLLGFAAAKRRQAESFPSKRALIISFRGDWITGRSVKLEMDGVCQYPTMVYSISLNDILAQCIISLPSVFNMELPRREGSTTLGNANADTNSFWFNFIENRSGKCICL